MLRKNHPTPAGVPLHGGEWGLCSARAWRSLREPSSPLRRSSFRGKEPRGLEPKGCAGGNDQQRCGGVCTPREVGDRPANTSLRHRTVCCADRKVCSRCQLPRLRGLLGGRWMAEGFVENPPEVRANSTEVYRNTARGTAATQARDVTIISIPEMQRVCQFIFWDWENFFVCGKVLGCLSNAGGVIAAPTEDVALRRPPPDLMNAKASKSRCGASRRSRLGNDHPGLRATPPRRGIGE